MRPPSWPQPRCARRRGTRRAARFAVGVDRGVVAAARRRAPAGVRHRQPRPRAHARARRRRLDACAACKRIDGVRWVEWLGSRRRRVAFTPTDPLASKQWYLQQDHAFDSWPEVAGAACPVKVAIVDSGIDVAHPDLASRIARARSFVGGTVADTQGHGTFVAGEIAAAVNNAEGIAGIGFPAQLLVAKVVRADGTISLEAEATAIRWAVDQGARVINLSLGGLRDPRTRPATRTRRSRRPRSTTRPRRASCVVAAVGNGDEAPIDAVAVRELPGRAAARDRRQRARPRRHRAELLQPRPRLQRHRRARRGHLLDAPARADAGRTRRASTRATPTAARTTTATREGTSFAAPQVSAAAALLIAQRPRASRPARSRRCSSTPPTTSTPPTGCPSCPPARDALTGWGRLDIAKALDGARRARCRRRPLRDERRRRPRTRRASSGARRNAEPRRSTSGTTRSTSTASTSLHGQRLTASLPGPLATVGASSALEPADANRLGRLATPGAPLAQSVRPGAHAALRRITAPQGARLVLRRGARCTAPGFGPLRCSARKR